MDSLSQRIRDRIIGGKKDVFYTVNDFADLNNDSLVARVLSRLASEGIIIRISQGLYLYPIRTKYGVKMPTLHEIATAIAMKDQARIIPSGVTALNELGLSTQVPMRVTYLTNGSPRNIKIGKRSIVMKHSAPRIFAYKTSTFPKVVLAMKELGEKNISNSEIQIILKQLQKEDDEKVKHDYYLAPQWIRKVLFNSRAQV